MRTPRNFINRPSFCCNKSFLASVLDDENWNGRRDDGSPNAGILIADRQRPMNQEQASWIDRLAEDYRRMVLATAYRVLGNTDDAEDVLQEVFLKLLRGKVAPESVQDWGAYLKVMATRAAVDLVRRRASQKRRGVESIELFPEQPGAPSPAAIAERRQKAAILHRVLATLPSREAAIFTLRYFEECSYEEIARQLGLSASQVGVILHRSRRRLLELLTPLLAPERRKEDQNV
jgi:RNA polymerase sigma-70 factor, ECF subfamily